MSTLSYEFVKTQVKTKGYAWFESGDYNLNIVGIRNTSTKNKITNKFDDKLTLSYLIDGKPQFYEFDITTDPGMYYSKYLLNKDGVAILVPGQYKATYQIGLHQGKYEALVQRKSVKVFRDNDKDNEYDMKPEKIDEGLFGINIHRSNPKGESLVIDKWSAGCQVFKRVKDFNIFMNICKQSSKVWGNSFTYTLIEL